MAFGPTIVAPTGEHAHMTNRLIPPLLRRRSAAAASIREVVFGVEDGVVQNMTLVAGMVGAQLSNRVIVIAAAINAIAGVLSMSMGTYLSSKAERDVALAAQEPAPVSAHTPERDAMVMAGAYAIGAVVPLVPFMLNLPSLSVELGVAIGLTVVALFGLGVLKATLSHQDRIRSGLEMALLASAAGLAGYLIGVAARAIFSLEV